MDHDRFDRMAARLAALPGAEDHLLVPCRGLLDGCPECIAFYRAVVGDERPTCLVCLGDHFAYEPHWAPDASTAVVELGVEEKFAQPVAWRWRWPVLLRYPRGDEGGQ